MNIERGKDISWIVKLVLYIIILGLAVIMGFILLFPVWYYIGLIVGAIAGILMIVIYKKFPKIYVKVSKY